MRTHFGRIREIQCILCEIATLESGTAQSAENEKVELQKMGSFFRPLNEHNLKTTERILKIQKLL